MVICMSFQGTGLSAKECAICDFFIYIPQYGVGTASLNVTVAASIVLHHFGGNGFRPVAILSPPFEFLFLTCLMYIPVRITSLS